MKKILSIMVVVVALLSGCDIETSSNGKLDGFWHLVSVDTLSTGHTADVSEQLLFLSVEVDLLRLSDNLTQKADYMCRFELKESTLRIYSPYKNDRMNGDPLLEDVAPIQRFGMNSLDVTFNIEQLSSGSMTLNDGNLRLHFKKM